MNPKGSFIWNGWPSATAERDLDIKPELYDLWLDRLVQAVGEFDPMFDPEIEAAWRRLLQPGIEFMKSRY